MNELKIFENPEFGKIRTIIIGGDPWFVGKDVASALGYSDTADAIKNHVDEDDKRLVKAGEIPTLKVSNYGAYIISESGVYSLVFGSKLGTAKVFKHWVTSEVLPQIRKSGSYSIPQQRIKQDIPVGEVAKLSAVMDRIMVRQQSRPHEIAQAFETLCVQFGIILPANFVKVPEYEQFTLKCSTDR